MRMDTDDDAVTAWDRKRGPTGGQAAEFLERQRSQAPCPRGFEQIDDARPGP